MKEKKRPRDVPTYRNSGRVLSARWRRLNWPVISDISPQWFTFQHRRLTPFEAARFWQPSSRITLGPWPRDQAPSPKRRQQSGRPMGRAWASSSPDWDCPCATLWSVPGSGAAERTWDLRNPGVRPSRPNTSPRTCSATSSAVTLLLGIRRAAWAAPESQSSPGMTDRREQAREKKKRKKKGAPRCCQHSIPKQP